MSKEIIQRIESLELTLKGWQEHEPDTERSKRIQFEIQKELIYDYRVLQQSQVNHAQLYNIPATYLLTSISESFL